MMRAARALLIILATLVFAMVFTLPPFSLNAQQIPQADSGTGVVNTAIEIPKSVIQAKKSYTYQYFRNRDPFESLIQEKLEAEPGQEPKDPREMYDIEVMRVVAIIHDDIQGYASVRLPDGKYYTLVKGTKIGIHGGQVKEIQSDRVVVKQTVRDFRRRLVEQIRELKLREDDQ